MNCQNDCMHDQYLQRWSSSLKCTTVKLRTYKLFKTNILYEKYLSLPPHLRVPLTRFRMSAHPLRIEVGRYHCPNPLPVEDRICQMCNLSTVEDELHFLLHCSLYKDIRLKLLDLCRTYHQSFEHLSHLDQFTFIMTTKNMQILSSLAHFLSQAFSIRARAQPPQ